MSEKEFNEICNLDYLADEAGGFVDANSVSEKEIHYDYRAILSYCKNKNIDPVDMTIREMQSYILA